MRLSPVMDNLQSALDFLGGVLDKTNCSAKVRMALETVVEEVFVNIVKYANATAAELTILVQNETITLTFTDDGIPFNPLAVEPPDITLPAAQRSIGGLGVLMVQKMTDRQSYVYQDGMNRLTLEKRLD